jgi:hypothetical protein
MLRPAAAEVEVEVVAAEEEAVGPVVAVVAVA